MISRNTEAALLLTAPLILKKGDKEPRLLTPAEYNRVEQFLEERGRQPSDLLKSRARPLIRACEAALGGPEIESLLGRDFRLSRAVAHWESRSIWTYSRSDPEYPERLKQRLGRLAPPVLYGRGRLPLPENGGLAIVGSIDTTQLQREFAIAYGGLAGGSGVTLVSGGSWGAEHLAMRAALDAGGTVIGVLTEGLRRVAFADYNRDPLVEGRLVLISPFDPLAGFVSRNAVARTKVIYALADAAVAVSAVYKKDVAWAGALALLKQPGHIPLYVRRPDPNDLGLQALVERGARIWSDPANPDALRKLLADSARPTVESEPGQEVANADRASA